MIIPIVRKNCELLQLAASRKMKARYIGWVGKGNLGDELLYKAMKKLFPCFRFYAGHYGRSVRFYEKITKKLFDFTFLGGGTLINKRVWYDKFMQSYKKYPFYPALLGAGVSAPFFWKQHDKRKLVCARWNALLQGFKHVGVRGPLSQQILHDQGIRRVTVVGDPVLFFAKQKISAKQFKKNIGINVGTANGQLWGGHEQKVLKTISQLCRILIQRGYHLTFVPVWPKDVPYIEQMIKEIDFDESVSVFQRYHDEAATFAVLESFDLFIGEKLHSVIMAICVNTPAIMLEYRPKCFDFMQSMGLEDFNYRVDHLDLEQILTSIDFIYDNMEILQEKIMEKATFYRSELIAFAEKIVATVRAEDYVLT